MAHTTIDHGPPHAHPLLDRLAANWWLLLLRGILAVIFGILAFAWPGPALLGVVLLYGAYAFADGIIAFVTAFSRRDDRTPTWWLLVMGVCGVLAGLAAFAWPGITAAVLVLLVAAWAIVNGIAEIAGAIELRKEIDNEWMLVLGGAVSILFGIAVLASPGAGALVLVWLIGTFALILGGSWIALALRLRRHAKRSH